MSIRLGRCQGLNQPSVVAITGRDHRTTLPSWVSPEAEIDTGEPVTPLTTEDSALLESMGTAFSPKSVPETKVSKRTGSPAQEKALCKRLSSRENR